MNFVAADAGTLVLGRTTASGFFNQINERALTFARDRAAEMVSQITDSTRDMLRASIADGLKNKKTSQQIAQDIQENDRIFGDERAILIADTEIANANGQGALMGLQEAEKIGIKVKKQWIDHEDACPICEDNADQGPIELDEDFDSGDDAPIAHPNCRCTLIGVIDET